MSRLELAKIHSLTFYKDFRTNARRTSPIPQLVCRGTPCKLYTPEVVRCVSLPGGVGTDIDWTCEADLPESLRFGRVEVSCEGWSKPGDPFVLKGSCSLEYRLVQVPGVLRSPLSTSWRSYDLSTILFSILWAGFLFLILYQLFLSCLRHRNEVPRARRPPQEPRPGNSGWFPGSLDDPSGPPPPYSKSSSDSSNTGWRPGFWTGAALGGLTNYLYTHSRQTQLRPTTWDWERDRIPFGYRYEGSPARASSEDRGEGPSNLGALRRSTGLGGTNVR